MSRLRSTGTFSPFSSEGSSHETDAAAMAREAARLRREVPWLDNDIDVDGDHPPTRDDTFGAAVSADLRDAPPRQTLVPARRGTGASIRPLPNLPQRSPFRPLSIAASERMVAEVSLMTRQELFARAVEQFDGVMRTVEQLVSTLEEFGEDKTPTHSPKSPNRLRDELRNKMNELAQVIETADRNRTSASCLAPLQHRQLREFAESLDAFDRRAADRHGPQPKLFTPDEALLHRLRKALNIRDKRIHRPMQF